MKRVRQGLYLRAECLEEMKAEATRCGVSMSEMAQIAWRMAHPHLTTMPGIDDYWPPRSNADQTQPVPEVQAEGSVG